MSNLWVNDFNILFQNFNLSFSNDINENTNVFMRICILFFLYHLYIKKIELGLFFILVGMYITYLVKGNCFSTYSPNIMNNKDFSKCKTEKYDQKNPYNNPLPFDDTESVSMCEKIYEPLPSTEFSRFYSMEKSDRSDFIKKISSW